MELKTRKIMSGIAGLILGLCTLPLAIIGWPLCIAAFLYNEQDEEEF